MSKKENKKRVEEELYDMEEDIANSNDEYWLLNVEEEKSAFEEEMALRDAYFELYNSQLNMRILVILSLKRKISRMILKMNLMN